MAERIASTFASRFRRPYLDAEGPAVERPGRVRRLWSVLPVAVAFALFGVVVWLAYQDAGLGPPTGEPPLIRAAPDPVKLRPDETEDSTLAAEQGTIGRLWSDAEPVDQPERLLPTPEAPLSPPAIEEPATAEATVEQPASETAANGRAAEATVEQPASETAADGRAPEAVGEEESQGVAALSSEPDISQSEAAQPATDESLREAEAALDRLLAEVTATTEETDVPAATARAPADNQASVEAPVEQQESPARQPAPATASAPSAAAPAATPAPADPAPAPLPQVRPAGATTAAPARAAEPPDGSTETAALTGTGSRPAVAADGEFRIQLAAVRGEADARRAWQLFTGDLGSVLAGIEPIFERADTANGMFYRVQVGPFASQEAAESLCEQLKERNASCFVIRR